MTRHEFTMSSGSIRARRKQSVHHVFVDQSEPDGTVYMSGGPAPAQRNKEAEWMIYLYPVTDRVFHMPRVKDDTDRSNFKGQRMKWSAQA